MFRRYDALEIGLYVVLALGVIVGGAYLVIKSAAKSARSSSGPKVCPYCAENIKAEATVCRYCGRDLPTTPEEPTAPE